MQILADFTRPGITPWKPDGPVFGTRPLVPGDLVPGTSGQPLPRILTWGAAVRDPFWNRLRLTPGTEVDSGSLGAAARAGRTLLTPTVTLTTGRLHYLIRGQAQVYAGVDTHLMIAGPLHGGLVATFDTGGELRWVTHDLTAYAGHRAHLEIAATGEAPLEVLMAVDSAAPPAWLPATAWELPADAPSLQAVAGALQSDIIAAVETMAAGGILTPRAAALADWIVQNPALSGIAPDSLPPLTDAAVREEEALAATIRWDSPAAVSMADGTGVDERILIRGKPGRPGAVAPRRLPEAFGLPCITTIESSGRAGLAEQLTRPDNPLVARVIVNRIWHHLFGRGIVPTVDNFGWLGERPSHPELLDHLAWQFIHEDHWSMKRLIRRLVLTDSWARSSRATDPRAEELDPANALLHRMPVQRLEGEAVRDALLVVSGRFDPRMSGPPVPLHMTEFTVGRGQPDATGTLDGEGRRSIYVAARRNLLPAIMLAFDLPTPFSTVGRRNVTNVPAQSLVMMNDPFVRDQAAVWAARMLREMPACPDEDRVVRLFETAFTRPPAPAELRAILDSLTEIRSLQPGGTQPEIWTEVCHALLTTSDFLYLK